MTTRTAEPAEEIAGRVPYDTDAEEAVLGSLLLDPTCVHTLNGLEAGDFYRERNGQVYGAIRALVEAGKSIDVVTLANELAIHGQLEAVGGIGYLSRVLSVTPSALHVEHYGEIVRACAFRRRVIQLGGAIAASGYAEADVEKLRQQIDQRTRETIAGGAREESAVLGHGQAVESLGLFLEQAKESWQQGWITSGLPKLDEYIRLRPATLTVVAGATGHGKSILLERYAEAAAQCGKRAVLYHYELTNEQMLWRRNARHSNVPFAEWESGRPAGSAEVARLQQVYSEWKGGVTLVYCPGWTLGRIVQQTRRLEAENLADLVLVDYAQKIPREGLSKRDYTDTRALGVITDTLKQLADTLPSHPPIVLASQLNRTAKTFDDCTLDALRDSGEIAEYSNAVVLLWNEHRASKAAGKTAGLSEAAIERKSRTIRVRVDKNTFGPVGTFRLLHRVGHFDVEPWKGAEDAD